MGVSSSTSLASTPEQQEQESLAASTASLESLRAAFSRLSAVHNSITLHALQETFALDHDAGTLGSDDLARLLPHLGPAVVELAFSPSDSGVDWIGFLRGYNRCCARVPASSSLAFIYRVYSVARSRAGMPCGLEFDNSCGDDELKASGFLKPFDVLMLLWICWIFCRWPEVSGGGKVAVAAPALDHIVRSVLVAGGVVGGDEDNLMGLEKSIPVPELTTWILGTAPGMASCLSQFVHDRIIRHCAALECGKTNYGQDGIRTSSSSSASVSLDTYLLTSGRAWAISLSTKSNVSDEFLRVHSLGMSPGMLDNLLYRSCIHGKGLSRFWSAVEGYHGPMLVLFSATSGTVGARKCIIGVLTGEGFENRDTFYGSSTHLYAIDPIFNVIRPSGKEKNFMYCHLQPSARTYEPHPKPVGLAFGGSIGNERIFVDEDFTKIMIRHHAVDKTYQKGSLIPNQGFLPVIALLLEAEVWGLGGKSAKNEHDAYKQREVLFSEQRRKVDLKTFASWEDSPEKMMMDMVSDPNSVRREDR